MTIQEKINQLQSQLNEAKFQESFYYAAWEDTNYQDDLASYEYHKGKVDTLISSFDLLGATHDSAIVQDASTQGERKYKQEGHGDFHFNPNEN